MKVGLFFPLLPSALVVFVAIMSGGADGRFVVFCLSAGTVYGVKPQSVEKFSIANFVNLPKLPRKNFYFCQIIRIFARF